MAEQKLELKKKYRSLQEVAKETAEMINGLAQEMTSKMWEIGKILVTKEEEVEPIRRGGFYMLVAEYMKVELPLQSLYQCAKYYRMFPDLFSRIDSTKLTPTHYWELAKRDLSKEEIKEIEIRASKENWSIRELKEHLPKRPEILKAEALEAYEELVNSFTDMQEAINRLMKSEAKGVLSQNQINGLARSFWIFMHSLLPKFVRWLEKHNAEIDPRFKKYVEKIAM